MLQQNTTHQEFVCDETAVWWQADKLARYIVAERMRDDTEIKQETANKMVCHILLLKGCVLIEQPNSTQPTIWCIVLLLTLTCCRAISNAPPPGTRLGLSIMLRATCKASWRLRSTWQRQADQDHEMKHRAKSEERKEDYEWCFTSWASSGSWNGKHSPHTPHKRYRCFMWYVFFFSTAQYSNEHKQISLKNVQKNVL